MRTRRIIVIICTMLADSNPTIKIYCWQIEFRVESLQTHIPTDSVEKLKWKAIEKLINSKVYFLAQVSFALINFIKRAKCHFIFYANRIVFIEIRLNRLEKSGWNVCEWNTNEPFFSQRNSSKQFFGTNEAADAQPDRDSFTHKKYCAIN